MSEEPRSKSRVMAWTLVVIAPVVYLLSVPWVLILMHRDFRSPLFEIYSAPWCWVVNPNTPLQKPMRDYRDWCLGYKHYPNQHTTQF